MNVKKWLDSESARFIWVFILCYLMFVSVVKAAIDNNNYIYAIEQLHTFDSRLFNSTPTVLFHEFSPRFVMNNLVSVFMRYLHFAWEDVVVLFIFINIIPYAFGTTNTVFRLFSKNRLIYAVLLNLFILHGVTAGLGMYGMYGISTIGSAIGISYVALSYIVGEKKRWNMAWFFVAVACFVHIHDGIWGGGVIFVLWIADCILEKKVLWKDLKWMPVYLIALGVCTLPSLFSNACTLSDKEFIDIYVKWRHPHHLMVSAFGKSNIIRTFTFIVYPVLFGLQLIAGKKDNDADKQLRRRALLVKASALIVSWCLALLVMYIFIEIIPIALIASVYPIKYLRYVSFCAVIGYTWMVHRYIEDGYPMLAISMIIFAFIPNVYSFILLFTIIYCIKNKRISENAVVFYFLIVIMTKPFALISGLRSFLTLLLVLFLINAADMRKHTALKKACCLVAFSSIVFWSFNGKLFTRTDGKFQLVTPHDYLTNGSSEEIYQLSKEFKSITDENTVFLADYQSLNAFWLQILSERSCYMSEKAVPSSKGSIQEWYTRYLNVKDLFNQPTGRVYEFMKENNIRYLLVDADDFTIYDESERFHCVLKGLEGSTGIYEAAY